MSTFSSSGHHAPSHKKLRGQAGGHTAPTAPPRASRASAGEDTHTEGGFLSVLPAALFALPVTAGIGLILLLVTTGIVLSVPDPDAMVTPLSMSVLGVTSLLGGLVSARRCGHSPLMCGLCGGMMFTLLLWVLTLFIDRSDPALTLGVSGWGRFALHAAVVALAAAGGLIGGRSPKQKRTHGKRR